MRMTKKQYEEMMKKNQTPKRKQSKYKNKKININGLTFDSTQEYHRYNYLLTQEKIGNIQDLEFHNKKNNLILLENPKIVYEPDFCYKENGVFIIEDLKGFQTKEFKLKKKMIISKIMQNEIIGVFRITKFLSQNKYEIIEEYHKNN